MLLHSLSRVVCLVFYVRSLTLARLVYTDCRRPIYAGNAIATVQSGEKLKLLTVRTTAFEKVRLLLFFLAWLCLKQR